MDKKSQEEIFNSLPEDLKMLLNENHINIDEIINPLDEGNEYDFEELTNEDKKKDNIQCIFGNHVVKDPLFCVFNHVFCKECISKWIKESQKQQNDKNGNPSCPFCRKSIKNLEDLHENKEFNIKINMLQFICKVCKKTLKYSEYLNHKKNCKQCDYECQVPIFDISSRGDIMNIEKNKFKKCNKKLKFEQIPNHIKYCAFRKNKCRVYEDNCKEKENKNIECDQVLLSLRRKIHHENECKIRIKYFTDENDNNKYMGEISDNKKEGYGILLTPNTCYVGEFKNDKKEGIGEINIEYTNENGQIEILGYRGEFKDDNINGYGTKILINKGIEISGKWRNNILCKYGIIKNIYINNQYLEEYQGEIKNYKKHGFGILDEYFPQRRTIGFFQNGEKNGYGICEDSLCKYKYEGNFKDDKQNGYGILNNFKYEYNYKGEFKNDKMEGNGILEDCQHKFRYKGKFNNNNIEGVGELSIYGKIFTECWESLQRKEDDIFAFYTLKEEYGIYINIIEELKEYYLDDYVNNIKLSIIGSKNKLKGFGIQYKNNKLCYIGKFENGLYEGIGKEYDGEKIKYKGIYKGGMKNEFGFLISEDGSIYEGEFKNDKKNGLGILISKDGIKYEGEFKDNKKNGLGILISKNGLKYQGEFKNDKIDGFGVFEGKFNSKNKDLFAKFF